MEKVLSLARSLNSAGSAASMVVKTLPAGNSSVFLGRDGEGSLHLLVELGKAKAPTWLSEISARAISARTRDLRLEKTKESYIDVEFDGDETSKFAPPFLSFVEDFTNRMRAESRGALPTLRSTFDEWKRAWAEDPERVSEQWVRGLSGELLFLEQTVKSHGPGCAFAWRGSKAPQDFCRNKLAFEVKSSRGVPHRPTISSLEQLDDTGLDALYLVCVLMEPSEVGDSLDQLVRRVRRDLSGHAAATKHFEEVLEACGYSTSDERLYARMQFSVVAIDVFPCTSQFPRLTRGSFKRRLDGRIEAVTYRLTLDRPAPLTLTAGRVAKHVAMLAKSS